MTGLSKVKPILVLGIGNPLLSDDGVGLRLLELTEQYFDENDSTIEFLDGGTQGIALIGYLSERKSIIILDAVSNNQKPGTIHQLSGNDLLSYKSSKSTAHESSATDIIKTALLTGDLPESVSIIGIEPEKLNTSIGLSNTVDSKLKETISIIIKKISLEKQNLVVSND